MRDLTVNYISFIVLFAAVTAILCIQRGHSAQEIFTYLTFIFIVVYSVHRR